MKTVWIIGGSSGIGLELAKEYLYNGHRLVVSARKASQSEALQELQKKFTENLSLVDIDVTDTQSVQNGVEKAWCSYGVIDTAIYNAGAYESMKHKEWSFDHFEMMNNVNYLGALRVIIALSPYFEVQKKGNFVFNLSISSYFGLPYGGGYSAPKAALLNLCESLQPELMMKNIKLQVINHGFVKTRLTAKNNFPMPQLLEPNQAAKKIYKELQKPYRFEIYFPRTISLFLKLLRMLPYGFSFMITKKVL
ncbi:MAG: SDR family NAD(P)-dependent oxidoreductase [Campylobacterales bacterium]|nr:SDR family NAD(P)-dependent oxidoreductase [Campylobacterales bacterium]